MEALRIACRPKISTKYDCGIVAPIIEFYHNLNCPFINYGNQFGGRRGWIVKGRVQKLN